MIDIFKKYLPIIIPAFIAITSIFINYIQFSENNKQDRIVYKIAYENRVMAHKPEIMIVDKPIINSVKFTQIKHVLEKTNVSDTSEQFRIYSNIEIDFDVKLTNKSKNTADMIVWLWYDTLNYNKVIEKKLFSIIDTIGRKNVDTNHLVLRIPENDTVSFQYKWVLGPQAAYEPVDECILHLYYLFQNELGDLYSYYYMVKYKIKFPKFRINYNSIPNKENLKKIEVSGMEYFCKNCLTYIQSVDFLDFYSEQEEAAIRQRFYIKEKYFDYEDEIAKKKLNSRFK